MPSGDEFQAAGLNQIYLAWQIAMQVTGDYEQAQELAEVLTKDEVDEAAIAYWTKTQPVLANAFGLVQQAMEMALKGRIAAISPYLLIARDPKDWPGGVETKPTPFSDFRTLDAADLVKVHNTFSNQPLDADFRAFWDDVRRDRNKMMHSVSRKTFDPALLVRSILIAIETLFSDIKWTRRLANMIADGKYAAYGIGVDDDQNALMDQIDRALRHLTTAECKRFFGFDPKRRSYVCPLCYWKANRDWQSEWPSLAQLASKRRGETSLCCIVCDETVEVERIPCINPQCSGSVIYEEMCLECLWEQDTPDDFPSGLHCEAGDDCFKYTLRYKRSGSSAHSDELFSSDEAAIQHCQLALGAPYLKVWQSVTIAKSDGFGRGRVLGAWVRGAEDVVWHPGEGPHTSLI